MNLRRGARWGGAWCVVLFGALLGSACRKNARTAPLEGGSASSASSSASVSVAASGFLVSPPFAEVALATQAGAPLEAAHPSPYPGAGGATIQRFAKGCIGPDGSGGLALFTTCEPPKKLGAVLAHLATLVPKLSYGSDLAAGVTFLPTSERSLHRPHEPRVAASIGKWFWAAAALHKQGPSNVSIVEAAAVPAFAISDNAKGRVLIDLAGGADAVNRFTEQVLAIPAADLSLCRYQGDVVRAAAVCYREANIGNFFTPMGALLFLEKIWRGEPMKGEQRAALLRWSKLAPDFGFSIGHQLPEAAQLGMHHKRAELPTNCCDLPPEYNWTAEIAIIPTPRGPYAVALSLAHSETYGNQIGAIEWASCVLYHAVAEDVVDPFAAGCKTPQGGPSPGTASAP